MKNIIRTLCCIIAASVLLFSFAACTTQTPSDSGNETPAPDESVTPSDTASETPSGSTVNIPEDLDKVRIGVFYSSFTDKLGMQFKESLDYLADSFNVEFEYIESGTGQEQGQAAFESALQTDLDGVLGIGVATSNLEACKNAGGIPYVAFCNEPLDEAAAQEFAAYECYLGAVADSNYDIGINAAEALYAQGVRNVALCGLTPGLAKNHDDRARGFRDGVDMHDDMTIIAEDLSYAQVDKAIPAFAASYPEMDGLFTTLGSEAVYQAINTEGLTGSVKLASVDISESTEYYLDNGTLVYIAGGQYGTIMTAFAVLYNYIYDGTRLIPDAAETVYREHIEIRSSEDYQDYLKYIDGDIPVYTVDEMAAMITGFTSEFDFDAFKKICEEYSLEDVVARHSQLF